MKRATRVELEAPSMRRAEEFLDAVRRSRAIHRGRAAPPRTREEFRKYVATFRNPSHLGHFVCWMTKEEWRLTPRVRAP